MKPYFSERGQGLVEYALVVFMFVLIFGLPYVVSKYTEFTYLQCCGIWILMGLGGIVVQKISSSKISE